MLSGIKQRGIVGKDGKIEIQTSELAEGTVVEVIILVEHSPVEESKTIKQPNGTTDYLLSNDAKRSRYSETLERDRLNALDEMTILSQSLELYE